MIAFVDWALIGQLSVSFLVGYTVRDIQEVMTKQDWHASSYVQFVKYLTG